VTGRKDAKAAAFERAFYPGDQVLVNRLGIRDAATLDAAERMFTDERVRGPRAGPASSRPCADGPSEIVVGLQADAKAVPDPGRGASGRPASVTNRNTAPVVKAMQPTSSEADQFYRLREAADGD
jgi:hypothetical protein